LKGFGLEVKRLIDSGSILALEGLIPKYDRVKIEEMFDSDELFQNIADSAIRQKLCHRICSLSEMIPSIRFIFNQLKYLEPACEILNRVCSTEYPHTIRQTLFNKSKNIQAPPVEVGEGLYRRYTWKSRDAKLWFLYISIWAFCFRNSYYLITDPKLRPRKDRGEELPPLQKPNPFIEQRLGYLLCESGFAVSIASEWRNRDPLKILLNRIRSEMEVGLGRFEEGISSEMSRFKQSPPVLSQSSLPIYFSNEPFSMDRRVGRPFLSDYNSDREAFFLINFLSPIHPPQLEHTAFVTSSFIKHNLLRIFFNHERFQLHSISQFMEPLERNDLYSHPYGLQPRTPTPASVESTPQESLGTEHDVQPETQRANIEHASLLTEFTEFKRCVQDIEQNHASVVERFKTTIQRLEKEKGEAQLLQVTVQNDLDSKTQELDQIKASSIQQGAASLLQQQNYKTTIQRLENEKGEAQLLQITVQNDLDSKTQELEQIKASSTQQSVASLLQQQKYKTTIQRLEKEKAEAQLLQITIQKDLDSKTQELDQTKASSTQQSTASLVQQQEYTAEIARLQSQVNNNERSTMLIQVEDLRRESDMDSLRRYIQLFQNDHVPELVQSKDGFQFVIRFKIGSYHLQFSCSRESIDAFIRIIWSIVGHEELEAFVDMFGANLRRVPYPSVDSVIEASHNSTRLTLGKRKRTVFELP
jgi:Protein of unknown function (DUF3723)